MANINNVFGKPPTRIKELIKKSGKKLKEVSQESGVPYGALSSYNQGTRTPKEENALKLATYFGVSVPFLLGIEQSPNKTVDRWEHLTDSAKTAYLYMLNIAQSVNGIELLSREEIQKLQSIHERKREILKQLSELQNQLFDLEIQEESLQNSFKLDIQGLFNRIANEEGEIELPIKELQNYLNKRSNQ